MVVGLETLMVMLREEEGTIKMIEMIEVIEEGIEMIEAGIDMREDLV